MQRRRRQRSSPNLQSGFDSSDSRSPYAPRRTVSPTPFAPPIAVSTPAPTNPATPKVMSADESGGANDLPVFARTGKLPNALVCSYYAAVLLCHGERVSVYCLLR